MKFTRRDFVAGTAAALPAVFQLAEASPAIAPQTEWKLPEKRAFRIVDNEWIPMKDGTALAARLWLPEDSNRSPVPVVMEYLPYRKDDITRSRDAPTGRYLAEHGIAFARIDMRGSGDSRGGLLLGEYMPQEQADGVAVIAWLSRQPWSNGSVGMRGKSWGGFNSLQIAALAPPELKAIMPMCFSDNRYTDDAHYIGGALGLTNFEWGAMFQTVLAGPPDPKLFGPQWLAQWRERLKGHPPVLAQWLEHQRFDAFWRRQSVGLDYGRIRCPVYCVGGWEDGYNNSIARALAELEVPRKALIGPWAHLFPPDGVPGPALDWVYEEVRWWEEWLRGEPTGIMAEPMFRFYMPERMASEVFPKETPGRWVAEDLWPSPRIAPSTLYLNSAGATGVLTSAGEAPRHLECPSGKVVGLQRMAWIPFDMRTDLAKEQTPDDRNSLIFDSEPLTADLEIAGHPTARLHLSADAPVAQTAVRLCELTAGGESWLVTYAVRNLTHRQTDRAPSKLTPGEIYEVEIPLTLIAHRFKKGNRIRLAVSDGLWPLVWPAPTPTHLTLVSGVSSVTLPVRPPRQPEPAFTIPLKHLAADTASGGPTVTISGPEARGRVIVERQAADAPTTLADTGTVLSGGPRRWRMQITAGEPNSGRWEGNFVQRFERADWGVNEITANFELTSTQEEFRLRESLKATHDGSAVFEKHWDHTIKRDLL